MVTRYVGSGIQGVGSGITKPEIGISIFFKDQGSGCTAEHAEFSVLCPGVRIKRALSKIVSDLRFINTKPKAGILMATNSFYF